MRNEETVLEEFLNWAQSNKNVRAVVITSSRVNPNAYVDIFSDYDIELIVTRLQDFSKNEKWIFNFGNVIAGIKEINFKSLTQLVLYQDGVRIDFQLYSVSEFIKRTRLTSIPKHWDVGYKILLDKDGVTLSLPQPTNTLFNIVKPTEKEFTTLIKDFWWDTTYVAKSLWRDEIFYAKYMFDTLIHHNYLKSLIEWYIGSQHEWRININKNGRCFKRYLDNENWGNVLKTFADSDTERNWESLFATTQFFSRIAAELAGKLNYEYPMAVEKDIIEYLKKIRQLEKNATSF